MTCSVRKQGVLHVTGSQRGGGRGGLLEVVRVLGPWLLALQLLLLRQVVLVVAVRHGVHGLRSVVLQLPPPLRSPSIAGHLGALHSPCTPLDTACHQGAFLLPVTEQRGW